VGSPKPSFTSINKRYYPFIIKGCYAFPLHFVPLSLPDSGYKVEYNLRYGGADMTYVLLRNGRYYFCRRVPAELKDADPQRFVRVALRTIVANKPSAWPPFKTSRLKNIGAA
jgi:hypothetical protein